MATYSSVLAWRIPGTEEPGGLLSMESHRVGHDLRDLAAAAGILPKWNLSFCDWLISLTLFSRFMHVVACVKISFPFKAE